MSESFSGELSQSPVVQEVIDAMTPEERRRYCILMLNKEPQLKISIDGPARSGKSSLSRMLVEDLNLDEFSSGEAYYLLTHYLDTFGFLKYVEEESSWANFVLAHMNFSNLLLRDKKDHWVVDLPAVDDDPLVESYDQTESYESELLLLKHFDYERDREEILSELENSPHPTPKAAIPAVSNVMAIRDLVDDRLKNFYREYDRVITDGRDCRQVLLDFPENISVYLTADLAELARREMMVRLNKAGKTIDDLSKKERKELLQICRDEIEQRNREDHNKGKGYKGENYENRGRLLTRDEAKEAYSIYIDSTGKTMEDVYLEVLTRIEELVRSGKV